VKNWVLFCLLLFGFLAPLPVRAEEPLEISALEIDIWPEYDRPEVLVIYRLTLSPQTTLPAQLRLNIPRQAGEPYSLAMKDVDRQLYNLNYTSEAKGDWLQITFTTPSLDVQLEYYDPRLSRANTQRSFSYRWLSDYPVQSLAVQVQEPVGVRSFKIEPDMGSGRKGQDGLNYYNLLLGAVKPGSEFNLRLEYDKVDEVLSSNFQPVQAAEINADTPGRTMLQEIWPWVSALLGALLIAVGLLWYRKAARGGGASRRRRAAKSKVLPGEGAEAVYCHQCGKRAAPGDAFCRVCGTRLRLE